MYDLVCVARALSDEVRNFSLGVLDKVRSALAHVAADINDHGLVTSPEEAGKLDLSGDAVIVAVATGGTSTHITTIGERAKGPILVLATSLSNSLPSALSSLQLLREAKLPAKLVVSRSWEDVPLASISSFLKAASVARALRDIKGVLIAPPGRVNSRARRALEKRFGVSLRVVDIDDFIEQFEASPPSHIADDFVRKATAFPGIENEIKARLTKASKVYSALKGLMLKSGASCAAMRCFEFVEATRVTACIAASKLNDEGVVFACEGDIPSMATMLVLSTLSGSPAWMGNTVYVDAGLNRVLLAHCTIATSLTESFSLKAHYETNASVAVDGRVREGSIVTAAKFSNDFEKLLAFSARVTASSLDLDYCCRTQIEVEVVGDVKKLLDAGFGNHLVLAFNDIMEELRDFCKITQTELVTV